MKSESIVEQYELGEMGNFNYLAGDLKTGTCFVIDPGEEVDFLKEQAIRLGLKITGVLLTHGHFDHVGGVPELSADLKVPVYLSNRELPELTPDCRTLKRTADNEEIALGALKIRCIQTPGHTPGCQCFLVEENLFTGDTLFVDAVGRTDLQGSNPDELFSSLQKIKQLPGETRIWPGHNYGAVPNATLSELLTSNVFLKCPDLKTFRRFTG